MSDRGLFPTVIETDRLRLERLCRENLPTLDLYEHVRVGAPAIDEITRYVTWDPHPTPKVTRDFLADTERAWDDGERAEYVVRPRQGEDGAGEFEGLGGLRVEWDKRTGTLGTWLRKPFWGRGYSGERAGALMRLAFDRLDLELVAVEHHLGNDKSRRAIEKYVDRYGGQCDGVFRNHLIDLDGTVHDAVRYTVSHDQWREAVGDASTRGAKR
jgi:RimJ/RimL family protein N-acetyltransferase